MNQRFGYFLTSRKPNLCDDQDRPGVSATEDVSEIVLDGAALTDEYEDLVPWAEFESSLVMTGDICVLGGV